MTVSQIRVRLLAPMAPDLVLQLDMTYPHELAKVHVLAWQALETANVPPFVLRTTVGDPS